MPLPEKKKRSGNERAGKCITVKQNQQREQTEVRFSEQSQYRREAELPSMTENRVDSRYSLEIAYLALCLLPPYSVLARC